MPDVTKSSDPAAEIVKAYEAGKDRRYQLLFAVNGGAFAVVKWLVGDKDALPVLGSLQLWHIGVGMALFTLFMVADIDAFGVKMRRKAEKYEKIYQTIGVVVLLAIGSLIVAGWVLAAVPREGIWKDLAQPLAVAAVVAHVLLARAVFGEISRRDEGGEVVTGPLPNRSPGVADLRDEPNGGQSSPG